jgi:iron complex outermembrane receptor protein
MGWAPNESINLYVKYSEGYNAGGHWPFACNDGYKPETLDAVEGGVNGRLFDGRLVADFAGYYNDFKNYQVFTEFPSPTGISSGIINAPKAEMWGGEFQVTALPTDNFTVNLGLSIMHSQYDSLLDTDPANPKAGLQNLAGNQMQRAPNHTEQVGLEYDWPVLWSRILPESTSGYLRLGPLRLRGEWYHTDYVVFRPFNGTGFGGANDRQKPYSIFNFYATLPTEDGKWSLRFFAKNFLAQQYFQYKIASAYARYGVGGAPQWLGADLTYHFD